MKNKRAMLGSAGVAGVVALTACSMVPSSARAATVFIEIDSVATGPDGQDTGFGVLGQEDVLGIWIWADAPGVSAVTLGFDIVGRTFGSGGGSDGSMSFSGVGNADPLGRFGLFAGDGVLSAGGGLIDNVELAAFPGAGVVLPTSAASALLIYADLGATPLSAGGGAFVSTNFAQFGSSGNTIVTYGWFQTPTPGAAAVLGLAGVAAARRRR